MGAHHARRAGWRAGKYVEEGGGSKADGIRPVLKLMQLIGALSGSKTVPQVALGYLKAKGAPACAHLHVLASSLTVLQGCLWLPGNLLAPACAPLGH